MGSEPEPQLSSTPKLSLFSLPSQPPEPPGMLTPPLQTMASVPFHWEEAPGKPRSTVSASGDAAPPPKPKAARCLDLPPRLLSEAIITNTPSPTTVLDGPYSGRSLAHTMSFSLGKASFRSPDPEAGISKRQISKERWNFSSWRWASFKDNGGGGGEDNFDFSPSVGGGGVDVLEVKITKGPRKKSSFFRSSNKSHFWTNIYESVKQAVPWRRKQERLRRMDMMEP